MSKLNAYDYSVSWFYCPECMIQTDHVVDVNGNWQCPGCGKITRPTLPLRKPEIVVVNHSSQWVRKALRTP